MLSRFSFLSNLTYDQHLLATGVLNATQAMPFGPARDIVQATLYGNLVGAQATIRGAQEVTAAVHDTGHATVSAIRDSGHATVSAIQDSGQATVDAIGQSTQALSGQMHKAMLANVFGSLMVSGTIAISTALMLKRMDKIAVGIDRVGAQFTEGMSLLSSKLDVQANALGEITDQLGKIHETLKSPTITQATEHRNLGLQRLGQGLWREAETSFIRAINLDETDPISHLMLGKIYLDAVNEEMNLHDPTKAEVHFGNARRYSASGKLGAPKLAEVEEESTYLLASALLAVASQQRANSERDKAHETILQALQIIDQLLTRFPGHLQGMYLRTKLLVIEGKTNEAIAQFADLVQLDSQFIASALTDDDFVKYSDSGMRVIESQESWYKEQCVTTLQGLFDILTEAKDWDLVPEEFEAWLRREKLSPVSDGIREVRSRALSKLVSLDQDTLVVLKMTLATVRAALETTKSSLVAEYEKASKEIRGQLSLLGENTAIYDPAWLTHPLINQAVADPNSFSIPPLHVSSCAASKSSLDYVLALRDNLSAFVVKATKLTSAVREVRPIAEKKKGNYEPAFVLCGAGVMIGLLVCRGVPALGICLFIVPSLLIAGINTWAMQSSKTRLKDELRQMLSSVFQDTRVSSEYQNQLVGSLMS